MIWKGKGYGYAAHNFALSIKSVSPSLPIHLITDDEALKGSPVHDLYEGITMLPMTPQDPALAKMQVYDKLPFDHNLYLDVDALCVQDLEPLFDQLEASEKEYRCAVHAWYDKDSPEKFPLMVWARKSTIWDHYGFTDEKLPATQSSIQYIRKGEFCENLYRKIQENYNNCIPLDQLASKWGGGQPDELYLNITLAQMGYDPTVSGVMYWGNERTLNFSAIKEQYYILSMFGTAQNIKKQYIDAYDGTMRNLGRQHGIKIYPWSYIAGQKIANKSVNKMAKNNGLGRAAFDKRYFPAAKTPTQPVKGTVHLYLTNLYETISEARKAELHECHRINCLNPIITNIYNFGNVPYDHPKVVNIPVEKRQTYQDLFDHANTTGGDYTIVTNSDLYYDETLNWLDKVNLDKVMLALCRYNLIKGHPKLEAYSWSQGTWIFKGKITLTGCDQVIGLPGCENSLAYDAVQQGYKVANPAKEIKAYHLHDSDFRTYTQADRIQRNYLPVLITSILELQGKPLLIKQPGAVGDIICCLPIAKYYAEKGYQVSWLCPKQFHAMFDYMSYATPVLVQSGKYEKIIDLSFGIDHSSPTHRIWKQRQTSLDSFVTLKYELAGVPISELRKLTYNRNEQKEKQLFDLLVTDQPFGLVHNSSNYGSPAFCDTLLPVIEFKPIEGYTIFDWRQVIEAASEIHCIDSSLCNFVDALPVVLGKLKYYKTDKCPNKWDETILTKEWEIINQLELA